MRHEPICKKVFNKKRKPFNSFKQRVKGTDIGTVKRQPLLKVWLRLERIWSLFEVFHLVRWLFPPRTKPGCCDSFICSWLTAKFFSPHSVCCWYWRIFLSPEAKPADTVTTPGTKCLCFSGKCPFVYSKYYASFLQPSLQGCVMMMMRMGRHAYVYSFTQIYQITENDGDHVVFSIPSYAPFDLPQPEHSCWSVLFPYLFAAVVNRCQKATSAFLCLSKKKKVYFVGNIFLLERENPHLNTFLCPSQEFCVFLNFLCRISRWRNLTGGSTMQILLMPFNQPNKWQKLCKKVVLFLLLPHQASIQVCGSVYHILDLVLISSKAMSSYYVQLDFSFVPRCTTPCELWFLPYSFFFFCVSWLEEQCSEEEVGRKRKIGEPLWLIKVASLEPGVSALGGELGCLYTANGTIVWQSAKHTQTHHSDRM